MNFSDILVRSMPGDYGSITAALVWGQKRYLTSELYQLFKQAGVLHLAVMSGQNITLVSQCIRNIFPSVSPKVSSVITLLVGIFYLSVLPHEAPIIRAVIMGSIASIGCILNRPTIPLLILLLSCLVMLGLHISWIYDLSFLLSISATAGIILIYPLFAIKRKGPIQHYLYCAAATSCSAQIGIFPITFFVFREYQPLSLVSNILLIWLIEPIMVLGIGVTILEYCLPGAGVVVVPALQGLAAIFLFILSATASLSQNLTLFW